MMRHQNDVASGSIPGNESAQAVARLLLRDSLDRNGLIGTEAADRVAYRIETGLIITGSIDHVGNQRQPGDDLGFGDNRAPFALRCYNGTTGGGREPDQKEAAGRTWHAFNIVAGGRTRSKHRFGPALSSRGPLGMDPDAASFSRPRGGFLSASSD